MDNRAKIQRISAYLQMACYLVIALGILLYFAIMAMFIFSPDEILLNSSGGGLGPDTQSRELIRLLPAHFLTSVPQFLFLYGVWRLSLLFSAYKVAEFFTAANARHMSVFALMLFLGPISAPIMGVLSSLVMSIFTENPSVDLTVSLNIEKLVILLLSGLFMALSWIMREGAALAEENAAFV